MRSPTLRTTILTGILAMLLCPGTIRAQKDAREILSDHSVTLRAGDLSITWIYLQPEVAQMVLTSDEFARYERERLLLRPNWSLMALRVSAYRDARFDPTLLAITQLEVTHTVGFQDVVDVRSMFNSTIARGEQAFGFIKVPDRIDFRQPIQFKYENYVAPFQLPLKWRQKYFQFQTGPGTPPPIPPSTPR